MGIDDGWTAEELDLREVLEQMLEWQRELMVVLRQILHELNDPGTDRNEGGLRSSTRPGLNDRDPKVRGQPRLDAGERHPLPRRRRRPR